MIYGTIQDFYMAVKGPDKSIIKILVKAGQADEAGSCTICAEIPNDALKYDMVKAGSSIAWKHPKVFINIEGVDDVEFKKVGNANGDEKTFYEHLKTLGNHA